jgi:hypothetical protein
MILSREHINADVANKKLRALAKVRYLINGSPAETTRGSCHRRAPSLPSQRNYWLSEAKSASGPISILAVPGLQFGFRAGN